MLNYQEIYCKKYIINPRPTNVKTTFKIMYISFIYKKIKKKFLLNFKKSLQVIIQELFDKISFL